MTERLLLNINVDEWSSLSIGKKEISEVDRGCNDTEKEKMEKDVEGLENNEIFQMERELIQRLEQTPKRKLSPDTQTPTGRSRKRSTSVYNSPVLRERIELAGGGYDQQENGAPDLIQGIGLLQRRETPGAGVEIQAPEQRPPPIARIFLTPRFRSRTSSESINQRNISRTQRRRAGSVSQISSSGQRRITDIFREQNEKSKQEGQSDLE